MYTLTYKIYCEFVPFGKYLNLKETNWFLEDFHGKKIWNFIAPYISLSSPKHES